jgi:hypothetical protein
LEGHDACEINRFGAIIYLGENKPRRFLRKHEVDKKTPLLRTSASRYELTITPNYGVNVDNFPQSLGAVVEQTNCVLTLLREQYRRKDCKDIKLPA